jgi:hypothetical protein
VASSDLAHNLVRRRVDEFDQDPYLAGRLDPNRQLDHFIQVILSFSNESVRRDRGILDPPVIDPTHSDAIVGTCRLIADIAKNDSSLVKGPLRLASQHWIRTNLRPTPGGIVPPLAETEFVRPDQVFSPVHSPKPFGVGLFTSTATSGGKSMWRSYLDMFPTSILNPLPWHTWKVEVDTKAVSILEVTTASEWAAFVDKYAQHHAGLIYPEWPLVAQDYDAVHLTLRAIAAIQGIAFRTRQGITAPAFWDVEQTLWLRWGFSSVSLVDVVNEQLRGQPRKDDDGFAR